MKKLFILLTTALVFMNVNAASEGITAFNEGDIDLGIMIGVPGESHANMPTISIDGSWGLMDKFINTKTFGQNGGIDLGGFYGITAYDNMLQNTIVFRSAFHFQFVPKLDTYLGIAGGISIWSFSGVYKDADAKVKGVFGFYTGAKYYFSDMFGVKMEFASDMVGDPSDLPWVSAGVTFKF